MFISIKRLIILVVLVAGIISYLEYRDYENQNKLIHLYNQKTDATFLYLLQEYNPNKELVFELENLAKVDEKNRKAFIDTIVRARNISGSWGTRLMHLAHLSDKSGIKVTEENSLRWDQYLFRNATKAQFDIETDIFRADIRNVLYIMNIKYNNYGPNSFDERERSVLKKLAEEVQTLDRKYAEIESYSKSLSFDSQNTDFINSLKEQYMQSLRPSIEKIALICDKYQKEVNA